ncbi:peptidase [Phyllobacterium sp. SYP-B3895]|uniref:peptidase n=1 Tax=Phyllobacterium sp. SYP-B3895 TaxID=2663240 RepID=UPI001299D5FB|nr:peptidase [Phyllobacterium sp. SYP-B3895]MRG54305.1 peptidase [Phyllobacterium sp. SYP-B3895]
MNFRYSVLALLVALAACDDSKTAEDQSQAPSTFAASEATAATAPVAVTGAPVIVAPNPETPPAVVTEDPLAAVRREAAVLKGNGKFEDAASKLSAAGLLDEAGALLADAGLEEEAFDLLVPEDHSVNDTTGYDTGPDGLIMRWQIDETTSVKRGSLKVGAKTVPFTARAGHLIAYAPEDPTSRQQDAQAAIFYTAYTRDGLPKGNRPITFVWDNGASSLWLHMASWGPNRLRVDAPIPQAFYQKVPTTFPLEENSLTLLDKTDLVFIDPVGMGYSTAIAPFTNKNFAPADTSSVVIRDFIIRYNNVNDRQSSPKYLLSESSGSTSASRVANLLLNAGTGRFTPDKSGKPAIALSGLVLGSPNLDPVERCDIYRGTYQTCASYLPSFAMVGDYHKLGAGRGTATREAYLQAVKKFVTETYLPAHEAHPEEAPQGSDVVPWSTWTATAPGQDLVNQLTTKTGYIGSEWNDEGFVILDDVRDNLVPGKRLSLFDARLTLPTPSAYNLDTYVNRAFSNEFTTYMKKSVNYQSNSGYKACCDVRSAREYMPATSRPASTPDLSEALRLSPHLKLLILHGYEDLVAPGFQTELDLKKAALGDRIPVKWFEGGHMIYLAEEARAPMKAELDKFFDDPRYSLPPALSSQ